MSSPVTQDGTNTTQRAYAAPALAAVAAARVTAAAIIVVTTTPSSARLDIEPHPGLVRTLNCHGTRSEGRVSHWTFKDLGQLTEAAGGQVRSVQTDFATWKRLERHSQHIVAGASMTLGANQPGGTVIWRHSRQGVVATVVAAEQQLGLFGAAPLRWEGTIADGARLLCALRADGWIVALRNPARTAADVRDANSTMSLTRHPGRPGRILTYTAADGICDLSVDDALDSVGTWEDTDEARITTVDDKTEALFDLALAHDPTDDNSLWAHQRVIASRITYGSEGLLNCAGTGTGKTRATVAGIEARHRLHGRWLPSLVVAPPGVLDQWRTEFERYSWERPVVTVDQGRLLDKVRNAEIVITTPALLGANPLRFTRRDWNVICVDEASFVAGDGTRARLIERLRARARFGVACTATPGDDMKLARLAKRMCKLGFDADTVDVDGLGPYVFDGGWGDEIVARPWTVELRTWRIESRTRAAITQAELALSDVLRRWRTAHGQRRSLNQELMGAWAKTKTVWWQNVDRATQATDETLRLASSGPVVVFANGELGHHIHTLLTPHVSTARLHGRSTARERTEGCRRFERGELDVLVCSDALGAGVNLGRASHILCADIPDNTDALWQRCARAIRGDGGDGLTVTVGAWPDGIEQVWVHTVTNGIEAHRRGGGVVGGGRQQRWMALAQAADSI